MNAVEPFFLFFCYFRSKYFLGVLTEVVFGLSPLMDKISSGTFHFIFLLYFKYAVL